MSTKPGKMQDFVILSERSKPILFFVGKIELTDMVKVHIRPVEQIACIELHQRGLWGTIDEIDAMRNEDMIQDKGRVVSLYWTRAGSPIYVVTNLRSERTVI